MGTAGRAVGARRRVRPGCVHAHQNLPHGNPCHLAHPAGLPMGPSRPCCPWPLSSSTARRRRWRRLRGGSWPLGRASFTAARSLPGIRGARWARSGGCWLAGRWVDGGWVAAPAMLRRTCTSPALLLSFLPTPTATACPARPPLLYSRCTAEPVAPGQARVPLSGLGLSPAGLPLAALVRGGASRLPGGSRDILHRPAAQPRACLRVPRLTAD